MNERYVWVRYAGGRFRSRQLALVVKDDAGPQLIVRKFRANSGRWTGEVRLLRVDLLGEATRGEALKLTKGRNPNG